MLLIKELREELGITQKQLADGISNLQRNVSNWETGASEPDLQTLIRLADFFEVTLDELFGRNPDQKNKPAENRFIRKIFSLTQEQQRALSDLIDSFLS